MIAVRVWGAGRGICKAVAVPDVLILFLPLCFLRVKKPTTIPARQQNYHGFVNERDRP